MTILVWITLTVKDGNCNQVLELLDSPEGNDFTASQEGCERLERSVDHDNPNQILLTELWSSKEDWDACFEMQQEVRDNNGFNTQLSELVEENGIEIKFSEVNKSRRNDVPKHVKRILEEGDKVKHFLVVHNWISDEARRSWLTPPEKLDPPKFLTLLIIALNERPNCINKNLKQYIMFCLASGAFPPAPSPPGFIELLLVDS